MSKAGKFSFLFSLLFFIALMVTRLLLGGWHDGMWAPLGLSVAFFAFGVVKERLFLKEFLTMRTTKHGMNMGVLILIAIVLIVVVNVFAVRYEKKFDWTSEGLNSLSDQSVKAVQGLKHDVEIVLLYRKDQTQENIQRSLGELVDMYKNASDKIKYSAYNVLQRPDLAQKYQFTYGAFGVWAVQGDRNIKIEKPNEEGITQTLLKLGRDKKKVVYFTMGHGEREFEPRKPETITDFKQELSSTYEVRSLNLVQMNNKVPDDAEVVAVIGPLQQFLEGEIHALRDYARRGGHLLIALDPGQRHNLALLTKSLGVEFKNNFVLDPRAQIPGMGTVAALGVDFAKAHEITTSIQQGGYAVFMLTSEIKKAPDAPPGLEIEELVKSDGLAAITNELGENMKMEQGGTPAFAISVKGKLPAGADPAKEPEGKEFTAVIFGDSDFLSNALYHNNLNRDLTMNSVAWLSADKDLISIRPKEPKGTKFEFTNMRVAGLFISYIAFVIALFFTGGFVWWRRRTA